MARRLLVGVAQAGTRDAPRRYLLELLSGLASIGVEIQVALFDDGPVRADLEAIADVRRLHPLRPRSPAGLLQSLARRVGTGWADRVHDLRTTAERRWLRPPDCIHVHGPQAVAVLRYVRTPGVPVTTYAHPWDFSVAGLSPLDLRRLLDRTDRFLVADETVAADLRAAGADGRRIEPAPDPLEFPPPPLPGPVRAAARTGLGLGADAVVVGVPPVPDWAEAPDLTLALAWELERGPGPAPGLLWYSMPGGTGRWPVEDDIARMGLSTVHLADSVPVGTDAADLVDLFVLPSRGGHRLPTEFAAAAAARATPVLCWEGHPLAEEVLRWGGSVAPRGDVPAMAALVRRLADDAAERRRVAQVGWSTTLAGVERITPLDVPVP